MSEKLELPERFNAAQFFVDRNVEEGRGKSAAYLHEGGAISYAELCARVNKAGNALRQLDVRREERVAMLLPDVPEFADVFWGSMKIGAVALPLNTFLSPDDYEFMLRHSGATTLVVSAELLPRVQAILGRVPTLRHVLVTGGEAEGTQLAWARLLDAAASALDPADTSPDDMGFWLYTSGSTGRQKAVVHRHSDPVHTAELGGRAALGVNPHDLTFCIPRLFTAIALGWVGYFPLYVGGAGLLTRERPDPERMRELLQAYRPTVVVAPPTFYARMLRWAQEQNDGFDFKSVRLLMVGGEPFPPILARQWRERFNTSLLDHLGSTEALHIYFAARPGEDLPGCIGRPVEGYDMKLVGDDGKEVPVGEIGTLWIRGESLGYYWKNRPANLKVWHGEWFDTGDRYYQDAQGNFFFVGRADEMLRISGLWVVPTEVEEALRGHAAVDDAALVGVPDEHGLLKGVAFVIPRDRQASAPELLEFARSRLTHYKVPRELVFVDEFPRTASGKVQRFKLRERYRELGGAASGGPHAT